MARRRPTQELERIEAFVEERGEVSMGELVEAFDTPRRTLQSRVARLLGEGRLVRIGAGRGTRYQPAGIPGAAPRPSEGERSGGVPLGTGARAVQQAVSRPLVDRDPVGYRREFLDDYEPNHSRYLPEGVSEELARLGARSLGREAAGTYARKVLDRLLIDLAWSSSRLEGNTYSLLETERLLRSGEQAEGREAFETQMILNHKAAIEFLVEEAEVVDLDRRTVLSLHGLLADNLLGDPAASGRLRRVPVSIGGSVFHPLELPQLVEECFHQVLDTARAIQDPVEQAFFVLVHLPYLQPFEDVNKRVSRLAANIPFLRENLCPLSFLDVPTDLYVHGLLGVYEQNRVELLRDVFVWAYRRSTRRYEAVRRALGEPDPFRLKYRELLRRTVAAVVRERLTTTALEDRISEVARLGVEDRDLPRFREAVWTELDGLHEGTLARYRLRPSEFAAWCAARSDEDASGEEPGER